MKIKNRKKYDRIEIDFPSNPGGNVAANVFSIRRNRRKNFENRKGEKNRNENVVSIRSR